MMTLKLARGDRNLVAALLPKKTTSTKKEVQLSLLPLGEVSDLPDKINRAEFLDSLAPDYSQLSPRSRVLTVAADAGIDLLPSLVAGRPVYTVGGPTDPSTGVHAVSRNRVISFLSGHPFNFSEEQISEILKNQTGRLVELSDLLKRPSEVSPIFKVHAAMRKLFRSPAEAFAALDPSGAGRISKSDWWRVAGNLFPVSEADLEIVFDSLTQGSLRLGDISSFWFDVAPAKSGTSTLRSSWMSAVLANFPDWLERLRESQNFAAFADAWAAPVILRLPQAELHALVAAELTASLAGAEGKQAEELLFNCSAPINWDPLLVKSLRSRKLKDALGRIPAGAMNNAEAEKFMLVLKEEIQRRISGFFISNKINLPVRTWEAAILRDKEKSVSSKPGIFSFSALGGDSDNLVEVRIDSLKNLATAAAALELGSVDWVCQVCVSPLLSWAKKAELEICLSYPDPGEWIPLTCLPRPALKIINFLCSKLAEFSAVAAERGYLLATPLPSEVFISWDGRKIRLHPARVVEAQESLRHFLLTWLGIPKDRNEAISACEKIFQLSGYCQILTDASAVIPRLVLEGIEAPIPVFTEDIEVELFAWATGGLRNWVAQQSELVAALDPNLIGPESQQKFLVLTSMAEKFIAPKSEPRVALSAPLLAAFTELARNAPPGSTTRLLRLIRAAAACVPVSAEGGVWAKALTLASCGFDRSASAPELFWPILFDLLSKETAWRPLLKILNFFRDGWEKSLAEITEALGNRALTAENFIFLADCGIFILFNRRLRTAEDSGLALGIIKLLNLGEDLAFSFSVTCPKGLHSSPLVISAIAQKFPGPEPWRLLARAAACSRFHPVAAEALLRGITGKTGAVAAVKDERASLSLILAADAAAAALVDGRQEQKPVRK